VFGHLLVMYRRRLAMTQDELAERAGLSPRTIRNLEADRGRIPRPTSVRMLADALGLHDTERVEFILRASAAPEAALDESRGAQPAQPPADGAAAAGPDTTMARPDPPTGAGWRAPEQLPADVPGFVGRDDELDGLDSLLGAAADEPTAAVIAIVSGTAGVGKTALATRWAHRQRSQFPDGQLFVNLRGYDPDRPVVAADALTGFLLGLGVRSRDIPVEPEHRSALFRTLVSGRRMLILLDNAATVEQARPLLPGTPDCTVIVTSRNSLAGLMAREGARRLNLDLLPHGQAVALLRRLIGPRASAEPHHTAALATLCARLPLALRVAAELAAARSVDTVADLVAELSDRRERLDRLDPGDDPYAAVKAVFSWSLQHLTPGAARVFALLGLHPGPDADLFAATALAGDELAAVARGLDELTRAHLVQRVGARRYNMHDLLHAYATSLLTEDESAAGRMRLLTFYLAAAAAAMDQLYPGEIERRPRVGVPATPVPMMPDSKAALRWLDEERFSLVAMSAEVAGSGPSGYAVTLSSILHRYFAFGPYPDALTVHENALRAARQAGDVSGQGRAHAYLSIVHHFLGRSMPSVQHAETAIALLSGADDQLERGRVLTHLGAVKKVQCRYQEAIDHHSQALAVFRAAAYPLGMAGALTNIGMVLRRVGRHRQAISFHEYALTLFREVGDPDGEAVALHNLGDAQLEVGHYEQALDSQQRSLALLDRYGNRHGNRACALNGIGSIYVRFGDPIRAAEYHHEALKLSRAVGLRANEARALNSLGVAARVAGRCADALAHHRTALDVARHANSREEEARAHAGLSAAYRSLGDCARSREHVDLATAITKYVDLNAW
jgi:tetratricopeptide (TPR) repeat protein/transcriptional regulator with XRE-family HTH domain